LPPHSPYYGRAMVELQLPFVGRQKRRRARGASTRFLRGLQGRFRGGCASTDGRVKLAAGPSWLVQLRAGENSGEVRQKRRYRSGSVISCQSSRSSHFGPSLSKGRPRDFFGRDFVQKMPGRGFHSDRASSKACLQQDRRELRAPAGTKAGLRSIHLASSEQRPAVSVVQWFHYPQSGVATRRNGVGGASVERRLSPDTPPGQWLHGRGRWALPSGGKAGLSPRGEAHCATGRARCASSACYKM